MDKKAVASALVKLAKSLTAATAKGTDYVVVDGNEIIDGPSSNKSHLDTDRGKVYQVRDLSEKVLQKHGLKVRTAGRNDLNELVYAAALREGIKAKVVGQPEFVFASFNSNWIEAIVVDHNGVQHKVTIDLKVTNITVI